MSTDIDMNYVVFFTIAEPNKDLDMVYHESIGDSRKKSALKSLQLKMDHESIVIIPLKTPK